MKKLNLKEVVVQKELSEKKYNNNDNTSNYNTLNERDFGLTPSLPVLALEDFSELMAKHFVLNIFK